MNRENLFQYAESLSITSSQHTLNSAFSIASYALLYFVKSAAYFGGIQWFAHVALPEYSNPVLIATLIIWVLLTVILAWNNFQSLSRVGALNKSIDVSIAVLRDESQTNKHHQAAMVLHDAIRGLLDSVIKFTNNKHAESEAYICLSFLDSEFNLNFWSTWANIEWRIKHPVEHF